MPQSTSQPLSTTKIKINGLTVEQTIELEEPCAKIIDVLRVKQLVISDPATAQTSREQRIIVNRQVDD